MKIRTYLKVFIFIALLLFIDTSCYYLLNLGFFRTETGLSGGKVNGIRNAKAEVLILGSSRAHYNYNSEVIRDILGCTVYNGGWDGMGLQFMRGLEDLIYLTYTPNIVVLNIDLDEIQFAKEPVGKISVLGPFIDESEIVREMIYQRGRFEWIKYLSCSYRFNGKPFAILKNLFLPDKSIMGYDPLNGILNPNRFSDNVCNLEEYEIKPEQAYLINELIIQAQTSGSKVVLTNSPRWRVDSKIDPRERKVLDFLDDIAREFNVGNISITVENETIFRNPSLFNDPSHLNESGSKLFSFILAKKMVELGYARQ